MAPEDARRKRAERDDVGHLSKAAGRLAHRARSLLGREQLTTKVNPALAIADVRPDSEEALAIIRALDEDLGRRYPESVIHGLRPHDVSDPRLTFLVARLEGRCVGCGAVRELAAGIGEIKRMFVRPDSRGRGVARQLLQALETRARARGYRILRIETGDRQPEAIGLYRSAGYRDIGPFGEYIGNAFSVCFEKDLS